MNFSEKRVARTQRKTSYCLRVNRKGKLLGRGDEEWGGESHHGGIPLNRNGDGLSGSEPGEKKGCSLFSSRELFENPVCTSLSGGERKLLLRG